MHMEQHVGAGQALLYSVQWTGCLDASRHPHKLCVLSDNHLFFLACPWHAIHDGFTFKYAGQIRVGTH